MGFRSVLRGASLNIFVFLVVLALAAGGVCLFRDTLLRNAKVTGMALARNYAAEERSNLAVYETLLAFGTASMDKRLQEGGWRIRSSGCESILSGFRLYWGTM